METESVAMRRAERGPEGQAGRQQHLTEMSTEALR